MRVASGPRLKTIALLWLAAVPGSNHAVPTFMCRGVTRATGRATREPPLAVVLTLLAHAIVVPASVDVD